MSQTHFTRRHAPRASRGAGPKHPDALVLAQRYASEWAATERPEVVCDGDPHPGNVLRREAGWALIDPDGIVGERADDLGVVLRDACGEMVLMEASEPGSGVTFLREACRQLADLADAPGACVALGLRGTCHHWAVPEVVRIRRRAGDIPRHRRQTGQLRPTGMGASACGDQAERRCE